VHVALHEGKQTLWQDDYKIHSYEVDANGCAPLPVLCRYMQESAWNHAEHLGFGFSHLMHHNLLWVLSRQRIEVYSYPEWGETITVQTWPAARARLYYFRDFRIVDACTKVLAEATTQWFVMDLESRMPQRSDVFFKYKLPDKVVRVFSDALQKLPAVDASNRDKRAQVRYSDLDVNGHVNSVRYLDWLLDSFDLDFATYHVLREFEINYLSEAVYGDEIAAGREVVNGLTFHHALYRGNGDDELCRARTVWREADASK